MTRRATLFLLIVVFFVLALLIAWVVIDPLFTVYGDEMNLIKNPNFEIDGVRTFDEWTKVGCFSLVEPPKEAAAKMNSPQRGGQCSIGATSTLTQTVTLAPDTTALLFSYRRVIVSGGNRVTITISSGDWFWTTTETLAMSFEGTVFSQVWEVELPEGTEQVTVKVEGYYNSGIGLKVTEITLSDNN